MVISSPNQSFPLFLPISLVSILWQFIVLIYIVLDFVLTIMVQCFQQQPYLRYVLYNYFDRILILVLVLDILFSFNTCFIRKGIIITQRKQIALEYIKSVYFWIDAISLIVGILQVAMNQLHNYQTGFNFIVFIKIVKVFKFDKNIKRYALKTFNAMLVYQIMKNIFFLALLCHIMGCFFYLIDYDLIQSGYYDDYGPSSYWLLTSQAYTNIIDESLWVRYTYCFYFSTSILSGIAYGDLVPQNPIETGYLCFILLLPLVIYSYIFNAIYDVISKKRERSKQIKRYIFLAKRYLHTLRVKSSLQTKLITYLSYVFRRYTSSSQFIQSLAPSAKRAYQTHTIHAKFDFSIFEQLLSVSSLTDRLTFRDQLMGLIHQQTFPERYKMILPHRIKLYYINEGICKRVTQTYLKYSDDIIRQQFSCFAPFLSGIITPKLKYESASFVVAQTIDRKQFLLLLRNRKFMELKEAFFLMKQQKTLYNNETILGETCFFCHSQAHCMNICKYLRPTIKLKSFMSPQQIRKPYLRSHNQQKRTIQRENFLSKDVEKATNEVGVQWAGSTSHKSSSIGHSFESMSNLRIYYPEHNICQ